MMLTGRVLSAAEAESANFVHYLAPAGQALGRAMELAQRMARERAAVELRHHQRAAAHPGPGA